MDYEPLPNADSSQMQLSYSFDSDYSCCYESSSSSMDCDFDPHSETNNDVLTQSHNIPKLPFPHLSRAWYRKERGMYNQKRNQ